MIYYLYYFHQFINNGAWTGMDTAKPVIARVPDFFQRYSKEVFAGEQARSLCFWLGSDGDPN